MKQTWRKGANRGPSHEIWAPARGSATGVSSLDLGPRAAQSLTEVLGGRFGTMLEEQTAAESVPVMNPLLPLRRA